MHTPRLLTIVFTSLLMAGCGGSAPDEVDPIENIQTVAQAEKILSDKEGVELNRLLVCEIDLAMKRDGEPPKVDGEFTRDLVKRIKSNIGAADVCLATLRAA